MPAVPLCWCLCKIQWQPDKIIAGLITWFVSEAPKGSLLYRFEKNFLKVLQEIESSKLAIMLSCWQKLTFKICKNGGTKK